MSEPTKFESWAIVEVMGHNRFAGFVTEQAFGGASFVRVDVPDIPAVPKRSNWDHDRPAQPAFTKLLGASSIFAITPCTEAVARAAAVSFQSAPVTCVDLQPQRLLASGDDDREYEDEDDVDVTRNAF